MSRICWLSYTISRSSLLNSRGIWDGLWNINDTGTRSPFGTLEIPVNLQVHLYVYYTIVFPKSPLSYCKFYFSFSKNCCIWNNFFLIGWSKYTKKKKNYILVLVHMQYKRIWRVDDLQNIHLQWKLHSGLWQIKIRLYE